MYAQKPEEVEVDCEIIYRCYWEAVLSHWVTQSVHTFWKNDLIYTFHEDEIIRERNVQSTIWRPNVRVPLKSVPSFPIPTYLTAHSDSPWPL